MKPGTFSTRILDRALQRRRASAEALRMRVLEELRNALAGLSVRFDAVIVFGSLVTPGRFRPDSDVDVAFEGLGDDDYFAVKTFLERTLVRDVDVIQLEEHRLRDFILRGGARWSRGDLG